MKKKVCMFVWNHFTNDARVLRECSALAEAGYTVDLIAIHDHKNPTLPRREMRPEGFTVIRVKNELKGLSLLSGAVKRVTAIVKFNLFTKLGVIIAAAAFIRYMPFLAMLFFLLILLFFPRKLRTLYLRTYILMQMVVFGLAKHYDIVHSNDLNTMPQGFLCARLFRRRVFIYDSHEVQTSRTGYNSRIYGIAERFFIKHIDVMIMENHTRAKYIEDLYGFYPRVVHNYPVTYKRAESHKVDLYEVLDIPRGEPILLYQGGIQTGRGLDKLILATPKFERGVVVLIGDGKLKPELMEMVKSMNLEDRVRFMPKVPVEELLNYTRNAYLGFQILNNVCFNHYSASSNKLFEYIMSSVPVVACSFPEIQKVVEQENIGVCVDSHNPESIAEAVNYLLNHPEDYQLKKANCSYAKAKYNWENEKKLFLEIHSQLEAI
ncbi:glycosyltransferase involved in cell wall biosynthesis [Paenibacillus forsythiae]|uniref:Glycosyltransferase involved in cell wall biosynthesis n=1 Tax=Paenibacillus forsythiae TaxID=365616 RepID=A0ABU3HDH2_9BACL|nr:glycosyltransferase [Paenibacillus forsythiae]MDT3428864.1 glycosyltransferase involved in cell wall biosynthesis [Paenibacillus forsythiae]